MFYIHIYEINTYIISISHAILLHPKSTINVIERNAKLMIPILQHMQIQFKSLIPPGKFSNYFALMTVFMSAAMAHI